MYVNSDNDTSRIEYLEIPSIDFTQFRNILTIFQDRPVSSDINKPLISVLSLLIIDPIVIIKNGEKLYNIIVDDSSAKQARENLI